MAVFVFAQTCDRTWYSGKPMTRYVLRPGIIDSLRFGRDEYSSANREDIEREIAELKEKGVRVVDNHLPFGMTRREEVDTEVGEFGLQFHCTVTRTPLREYAA